MCHPLHGFGGVCIRESSFVCLVCSPGNRVAGVTKLSWMDCRQVAADININAKGGEKISRKLGAVVGWCLLFQLGEPFPTDSAVFCPLLMVKFHPIYVWRTRKRGHLG